MNVKLPLFICFLYSATAFSQGSLHTKGIFLYKDSLKIPSTYEIGPGQLTKNGNAFILGLLDGELDDYYNLHSDIYAYSLNPADSANPIKPFKLPNAPDSVRYFQCTASDENNTLIYVVNAFAGWNDNELGIAQKQPDGTYKHIRMLTELNDPLQSDAYPWISGDGLSIYYNRNFKMMFAKRKSVNENFSAPKEIDFDGNVQLEIVSCWLTPDEKTMFIVANNLIYRASRKSIDNKFSFPELMTDEFKQFYFLAGISFLPDRKTMYLYYSTEDRQSILSYKLIKGKAW